MGLDEVCCKYCNLFIVLHYRELHIIPNGQEDIANITRLPDMQPNTSNPCKTVK